MATSTESNPPAKDASESQAKAGASDIRGLSGVSDLNLEKSVIRRGLATSQEVEACKALRMKLAAKDARKAWSRSWSRPRSSPRTSRSAC